MRSLPSFRLLIPSSLPYSTFGSMISERPIEPLMRCRVMNLLGVLYGPCSRFEPLKSIDFSLLPALSSVRPLQIDVHYSLPKGDETGAGPPDDDAENTGTLFVLLPNATEPFNLEAVTELFSPFGELKDVRPNKHDERSSFVEFFDTRACRVALNQLNNSPFKGGFLTVQFAHGQ